MKLAMVQMAVKQTPYENLEVIQNYLHQAKAQGADMVAFGEMISCEYNVSCFPKHAITEDGDFLNAIAETAKELGIYVVAGSVAERDTDGKIYNTTFVFDAKGEKIAKHRKVHLFDINVAGGQYFMESDVLTAGNQITRFDTPWGKVGVCICYDVRFPEFVRFTAEDTIGVIVPAAFNMTTGPRHWQMNHRMRAMENQVYVSAISPAREEDGSYVAYGHSITADPWGDIVYEMDEHEGMTIVEWDTAIQEKIKNEFPLLRHKRNDLYELKRRK